MAIDHGTSRPPRTVNAGVSRATGGFTAVLVADEAVEGVEELGAGDSEVAAAPLPEDAPGEVPGTPAPVVLEQAAAVATSRATVPTTLARRR
jgi:hypothetical protein